MTTFYHKACIPGIFVPYDTNSSYHLYIHS